MKICYISTKSIHTRRWVEYFAEKGYEVHLITPEYDNYQNVKVHVVNPKLPKLSPIFKATIIRKLVKKINPDILHAHQVIPFGLYGALSGFHPFIVSAWGSDVLVDLKESIFKRVIVKYTLKKADVITTTAKFMGKYLAEEFRLPKNKIVRIPWGIDLKIFHRGYEEEVKKLREKLEIKDNSPVIISNRHMHPKYNIQTILGAIPYVTKIYPDAIFIFIRGNGDKNFEKNIKERISKMRINNNVRFIPKFIPPREMAVYLNASDVLVSIPRTDQFGSSVIEGIACGTIPLVSNIEAYKQYLEDEKNAFFIDPDDPKELAEKIIFCIEHPKVKDRFYKINKKIIEENEDWSKNAVKMEELYKNLLGG